MKFPILCFLFLTLSFAEHHDKEHGHKCIHHELDYGIRIEAPQNYENHPYEHAGKENYRKLASAASFSPIRFVPVKGDISGASADIQTWIMNTLVPAAVARHSQNLNVIPVSGPLYASYCTSFYTDGSW